MHHRSQSSPFLLSPTTLVCFVLIATVVFFSIEEKLYESLDTSSSTFSSSSKLSSSDSKAFYSLSSALSPTSSIGNLKGTHVNIVTNQLSSRLSAYCSIYPSSSLELDIGDEGHFEGDSSYTLHSLVANIRHGDRSAIHSMPNASIPVHYKHDTPHFIDQRALHYLPRFLSYKLHPLSSSTGDSATTEQLPEALNLSVVFQTSDSLLSPGQLTTRGFMQHILLGSMLAKAYPTVASSVESVSDIYIRSTNYERTIQSVLAMVSSMLPQIGGPTEKHQVPIEMHKEEGDEVMHGVGMRLSSHVNGGGGEVAHTGSCADAAALGLSERNSFKYSNGTLEGISAIFGEAVHEKFVTDLADSVMPRICHREALPCSASFPDKCITNSLVERLVADADRAFCLRYSGENGGSVATKLSMYPFMQEIKSALFSSVTSPANRTDARNRQKRIFVFSGHDTVIAPVLSALSVYQTPALCKWPPYASRIIFEVWTKKSDAPAKTMSEKDPQEDGALHPLPQFQIEDAREKVGIRVIFNGQDVTQLIPTCKPSSDSSQPLHPLGTAKLCPLGQIERQIDSLILPHKTFQEACSNSFAQKSGQTGQ